MMGTNTKIEWCDHTWNPWYGCPDDGCRSEGCAHCFARAWAKQYKRCDFDREIKRASNKTFFAPLNRKKYRPGEKVFVCDLSDFFHPAVPIDLVREAYAKVIMARPDLVWMFVTKRPERIASENWVFSPVKNNHWLYATAENQDQLDRRVRYLLNVPAAVRGISAEPLLGPLRIERYLLSSYDKAAHDSQMTGLECRTDKLNHVIVGGESGPGARPMHPDWARSVRDQCNEWNVPFFMKQMSKKAPIPEDLMVREMPELEGEG